MIKYVMRKKGFGIETILENGFSEFRNMPEEYFQEEGYHIITPEEFDDYHQKYINSVCYNWKKINEEDYNYALDVLPPVKWFDGGFFISEATFGVVHSFYQEIDGEYYTANIPITDKRDKIIKNLKEWLNDSRNV